MWAKARSSVLYNRTACLLVLYRSSGCTLLVHNRGNKVKVAPSHDTASKYGSVVSLIDLSLDGCFAEIKSPPDSMTKTGM